LNWSEFTIDTTINIEGLVAAIAIFGAVIGFIINLSKNWISEYKEKRYRGTNFVILDLLEQNFSTGLSEKQLWNLYRSDSTLEKRKKYSAYAPIKIGEIGFEGQLKHLQNRFLIRLTGPSQYHIDFQDPRNWKTKKNINIEQKKVEIKDSIDNVTEFIGKDNLEEILLATANDRNYSVYSKTALIRILIEEGNNAGTAMLITNLRSDKEEVRNEAVELLINMKNSIM